MIEKWGDMSYEEKMNALISEMAENYYRVREIDRIPEAIEINELYPGYDSNLDFFRIAMHSSIPYKHLETDIPIIGMGRMGGSIALGENKALVDYVLDNISPEQLEKLNFENLISDAYNRIGSIGAIFYPVDLFTQMHEEFDLGFEDDFAVLNTGIEKIKLIHSTNFSKWEHIVILGRNSIEWTRKLSFTIPPNLSDYQISSNKNEHFQSAYKMNTDEAKFMVGTVSSCRVIEPDNVIVYNPPIV